MSDEEEVEEVACEKCNDTGVDDSGDASGLCFCAAGDSKRRVIRDENDAARRHQRNHRLSLRVAAQMDRAWIDTVCSLLYDVMESGEAVQITMRGPDVFSYVAVTAIEPKKGALWVISTTDDSTTVLRLFDVQSITRAPSE